ncbi:MAG: MCE family protein [Saprospiraceae bacterium]|nr:MCE family protein [Saprospiraceae bacterium]
MKISNEIKVALLAIGAIALGFWGFKFLKGINVLTASQTFYVKYTNVDQLRPSSPVFIRGLQVGMVKNLYIDDKDDKTIIAMLNIDRGVDIPKDAVATIIGLTLMGGKAIEIVITNPCEGNCAESGDYLTGDSKSFLQTVVGDPTQIDAYTDRLRAGLSINIDSLARVNPNGVASSIDALDNSLKNIEKITEQFNQILALNKASIGLIANNLASVSGTVKANDKNISDAIANLAEITKQLKAAGFDQTTVKASNALDSITLSLNTLRSTLSSTTKAINRVDTLAQHLVQGQGLVGKTLTDEELYNNLLSSTRHLHLLLQDFRMHPERYTKVRLKFFGKHKSPKYANPVDDPAYQMLVDSLERAYSKQLKN